jgi:2-polyprenyl-6-methoxyphenol hydroxylase-like FAD-dependent oxidoreductase
MRAIVVGGGIGGLSAAVALQHAGHEVAVFERAATIAPVGAALSLPPNALKALEALGVADEVRARGGTGEKRLILTWRGKVLSEEPWGGLAVRRADLHEILLAASGTELTLGTRFVGFDQDSAGVTVRFEHGREERGDVLVGADGLHSEVRAQLLGRERPRYSGTTSWRAIGAFEHPILRNITETWGPGRRIGIQALNAGRVFWFAATSAPEGQHVAPGHQKAALRELFHGWHEAVGLAVETTLEDDIVQTDIYDRPPLAWWSVGRATLLGDAAHPMTPDLAQGAAQAIEDALVLADCLSGRDDPVTALRDYEGRRIPRTAAVAALAHRFHRLSQLRNPLAYAARNATIRVLPTAAKRALGVRRVYFEPARRD